MTTYRRADGELIAGEYGWVAELDWFEMDDEPTEYVEEVWKLESARFIMVPEPVVDDSDNKENDRSALP